MFSALQYSYFNKLIISYRLFVGGILNVIIDSLLFNCKLLIYFDIFLNKYYYLFIDIYFK